MHTQNEEIKQPKFKPTFNVNFPFLGITVITVNDTWCKHMKLFVDEFENNCLGSDEALDEELVAFRNALINQSGEFISQETEDPSFVIEKSFGGVICLKFNEAMRQFFIDFIFDARERPDPKDPTKPIIVPIEPTTWAFRAALQDPSGKQKRFGGRRDNYENDYDRPRANSYDSNGYNSRRNYNQRGGYRGQEYRY